MEDWEVINIAPFEQAQDSTTVYMLLFIMKFMSNTLSTMILLQQRGHESTNLCPRCGTVPETMYYMYQCNHEVSCGRWTTSVYALQK